MTFTFTIRAPVPWQLTWGALQRAVAVPIDVSERVAPDSQVDGILHVYRPGITTRAVEIQTAGAAVDVSVFTVASSEDHHLAVDLIGTIATELGAGAVETDDGVALPVADLREIYGDPWAQRQLASGVRVLCGLVDERPESIVSLQGPNRSFLLGERLLSELRAGPAGSLDERLVAAMRRTQWPPDCYAANVIAVTGGSESKQVRLAVLTGRQRTLLPDVDAVALRDPSGGQLYLAPADLAKLLPEEAAYLDERQLLVEPVADARWDALLRDAEPLAVDIDQL